MTQKIRALLTLLVLLDATLASIAFFFPGLWFEAFHGIPYAGDSHGLFRRIGATWAAFSAVQLIALLKWEDDPVWLAVVAGVRLSDVFTDWTYLCFAEDATPLAYVLLSIASPLNLFLGAYFLRLHGRVTRATQ